MASSAKKLGKPYFVFDSCESTNDIARHLADIDFPEGTAVGASRQTKGRGRMGRKWISPEGENIYLSVILKPARRKNIPFLSIVAALALSRTIEKVCELKTSIKWPNDIYSGDKKISGILSELKTRGSKPPIVIMGIGVNLNSRLKDMPAEIQKISSSVMLETGKKTDKDIFIESLFDNLSHAYDKYSRGSLSPLLKTANSRLYMKGKEVSLITGRKTVTGIINKINNDGSLRLTIKNKHQDFISGEIRLK